MKKRRNKFLDRSEVKWAFFIILAGSVFYFTYGFYIVFGFINHCIFEWPIRWDTNTCWNEQKPYAKEKATESATPFIP